MQERIDWYQGPLLGFPSLPLIAILCPLPLSLPLEAWLMVSKPCILRHGHLGPKPSTPLCFLPDEGYCSRSPPQNRGSGDEGHVWGDTPRCTDGAWSRPCHPQKMDLPCCCQGQRGKTLSRHLLTAVSLGSSNCRAAALSVCSVTSGNPWTNIFLALLWNIALPLLRTDGLGQRLEISR